MPQAAQILLIDDEQDSCKALSLLLGKAGYSVASCHSGEQALSLLKKHSYELIISDLFLPGVSGIDILKQVKEDSPQTCVILIASSCRWQRRWRKVSW